MSKKEHFTQTFQDSINAIQIGIEKIFIVVNMDNLYNNNTLTHTQATGRM